MKKSSIKFYLFTFLFVLSLVSFSLAGNIQCPVVLPPPDEGGHMVIPVVTYLDFSVKDSYQFLQGFQEFLAKSTVLF